MIGPVIATASVTPFDLTRADILDLVLIAYEGIATDLVAFRARGEVNADSTAFEAVPGNRILMGIIDERAFLVRSTSHKVVSNLSVVGIVQHDAVGSIA